MTSSAPFVKLLGVITSFRLSSRVLLLFFAGPVIYLSVLSVDLINEITVGVGWNGISYQRCFALNILMPIWFSSCTGKNGME